MESIVLFLVWGVGSIFCALAGSERKLGWFSALLIAVISSPLIGFLAVLCSQRKADEQHQAYMLQLAQLLKERLPENKTNS